MKPFRTQAVCVPRPEALGPKASSSEVLEPRFYRAGTAPDRDTREDARTQLQL